MMKTRNAFVQFVQEIWNDVMLSVIFFVPILMGVVFRFAVPYLESFLCKYYQSASILSDYYYLFDVTLLIMIPAMCVYAGTMVILGEMDNGIARYLVVTPLGRKGYVNSRIIWITGLSAVYSMIIYCIFHVSKSEMIPALLSAFLAFAMGVMVSLGIVAFAHNKVEGLALSKFSGFLLVGVIVAGLVNTNVRYTMAFLPSFWLTEFYRDNNLVAYLVGLVLTGIYVVFFYRRFCRKIK